MPSSSSSAYVLYVDHCGHPAPLSECFHATASRRLSSAIMDRHPPSTILEVDSAYCPQCLRCHDSSGAAQLGYCPKASCAYCPVCLSVVTAVVIDGACYYKCGRTDKECGWTSKECDLSVPVENSTSLGKMELLRALEDLGAALDSRRIKQKEAMETYFTTLTQTWSKKNNQQQQRQRRQSLFNRNEPDKAWCVESLESSIQERKSKLGAMPSLDDTPVERISLANDDDKSLLALDDSLATVPQISFGLQTLNGTSTPNRLNSKNNPKDSYYYARSDLLPLAVPLRVRHSRRCRAELAEGRPGILLKPKLNPLEGDSSLRTGHGQWWKKDSSAVHVVPRVRVVQHGMVQQRRVFLLQVTNPTLGLVRLRLCDSRYRGEPAWLEDDGGNSTINDVTLYPTTQEMPNLLVDTFSQTRMDLKLLTTTAMTPEPATPAHTATVELLSAEDSIIELGGKAPEIPPEVAAWKVTSGAETNIAGPDEGSGGGDGTNGCKASMRLVAQSASTAWFEVAVAVVSEEEKIDTRQDAVRNERKGLGSVPACSIPVALQIEVGKGSWESSLIQPKHISTTTTCTKMDGERDWVTFDLVLAWKEGSSTEDKI